MHSHTHCLLLLLQLLIPLISAASQCPSVITFVIGSSTSVIWDPEVKGEGITFLKYKSGQFSKTMVLPPSITDHNPTYLAISAPRLYAVKNSEETGSLTQLSLHSTAPHIRNVTRTIPDGSTSHISVIPSTDNNSPAIILVANYGFGKGDSSVTSFLESKNGKVSKGDTYAIPKEFASMVDPERQEAPHVHMVLPYGKGTIVPDLGSDIVWYFGVNKKTGKLSKLSGIKLSPGDGPRHADVHVPSDTVYVLNELSLTLSVLRRGDCETGNRSGDKFEECERLDLLKKNEIPEGENKASAIRISEDFKFLYTTVRFTDKPGVIVVFELNDMGNIKRKVDVFSSQGIRPRDMFIVERAPMGGKCVSFVAVVNTDSDEVVLIKRDTMTGKLENKVSFKQKVIDPASVLAY